MNVCWPIGMSIQQLQDLPSRAIEWHWVRGWSQTIESVLAVLVGEELSAQVVLDLFVILLLIVT